MTKMVLATGNKWTFEKSKHIELQIARFSDHSLWRDCEKLEYDVFLESGFVQESDDQRISLFDRYDNMEFFAAFVIDKEKAQFKKRLSGVARVIYASDERKNINEQFPTLFHAKRLNYSSREAFDDTKLTSLGEDNKTLWLYSDEYDRVMKLDPRACIDLASIAVIPSRRDGEIPKVITIAVLLRSWERPPIRYGFGAVDEIFLKKIIERNLPFEALGPSVMYWGSPCVATLVDSFKIPRGFQRLLIPVYRLKGYLRHTWNKRTYD